MDEKRNVGVRGSSWNGIPFYIGDLQKEADLLRGNCIAILKDTTFTVELKDLPTSMVHLNRRRIYISDRAIPANLRIYEPIVRRMRDGLATHEAGHILLGYPLIQMAKDFIARHDGTALCRVVLNIVEDRRINYRLALRYRWDFGKRLDEVTKVVRESWHHTLHMELDEVDAHARLPHTLGDVFHQLVSIQGLYGKDTKDLRDRFYAMWKGSVPQDVIEKDFLQACAIIEDASYVAQGRRVFAVADALYDILVKYVPEDVAVDTFAGFMGGVKDIIAPTDMEAEFGVEQKALEEERERGGDTRSLDSVGGYSAASGTGLEIPAPDPDMPGYVGLVSRNAHHIDALLRKLKRLVQPYMVTSKWKRHGRFMSEVLAHAYTESMVVPVENVYQRTEMRVEPLRSAIGLLVDVSASVSTEEARDLLTIISEVMGRWLMDQDFAVGIFGGSFQRIKVFVEPYHTTRARIGNVQCLSGTMAGAPTGSFLSMLRSLGKRRRVFVLMSDFVFFDDADFQRELAGMRRDGVHIVGIAFGNTTAARARRVLGTDNVRYVPGPQALPDAFFEVYRDVVTGRTAPNIAQDVEVV